MQWHKLMAVHTKAAQLHRQCRQYGGERREIRPFTYATNQQIELTFDF
ncbi:Uncharacterised protein [Vibrio cholerae]|nr:Uncharacterised protein [Vibrio cholerae]